LGFRVQGFGFMVLGFRVYCSDLRVEGIGVSGGRQILQISVKFLSGYQGLGFRVQGLGFRVQG